MLLKLAYIGLTIGIVIILFLIGKYAINHSVADKKNNSNKTRLLILGLIFWQVYILSIALTGFMTDFSFPPRFVILMIFPAFIFTGVFLYKNRKKQWLQVIPDAWLTLYQSFRILIESIFVATVAAGLLHKNVTIEGYNYDMIFAFTAPIMTLYIYLSKSFSRTILLAWNFLGLAVIAVIIFLFITTIYFPEIYGDDVASFPQEFGLYPYALVPGFLMPSAVFIHVLSIFKLLNSPKGT